MSFLRPASQQLRSRAGYTAARSFSRSALLLDVEKSQLEIKLRDGLKTAMKSKDKASLTCLKVSLLLPSQMCGSDVTFCSRCWRI